MWFADPQKCNKKIKNNAYRPDLTEKSQVEKRY